MKGKANLLQGLLLSIKIHYQQWEVVYVHTAWQQEQWWVLADQGQAEAPGLPQRHTKRRLVMAAGVG